MKRRFPFLYLPEYLLLRGFMGLINLFSLTTAAKIARWMGGLSYEFSAKRRVLALKNLDLAFGNTKTREQKEKIAREAFGSVMTSLVEFFRIPKLFSDKELKVEFVGAEFIDEALKKGKGVVMAISHLGSWELLAFLGLLRHYKCSVVGRPMRNPYVYKWVRSLRSKISLQHIDKTRAVKPLLSVLKENGLAGILIDQWAGNDGIWVDFFGVPTSTTSIPARLARKTGAALMMARCLRTGPGCYEIMMSPELPLSGEDSNFEEKTTLLLNKKLEQWILENPEQWVWGHNRWKSTVPPPDYKRR